MRLASWGSEAANLFQRIKKRGVLHAVKYLIWRIRLASFKRYILLQDRCGWYLYGDWIHDNESNPGLLPVTNSNPGITFLIINSASGVAYLKDTLNSLQAQSYPNWEASVYIKDKDILEHLKSIYPDESRLHWTLCTEIPPVISPEAESTGDWLGFLNAGDTLANHALTVFVSQMESHPSASIIYSDTDQLSPDGATRHDPSFWPDWSPELLLSVNYLSHALFRRDALLMASANGYNQEATLLRCTELADQIIHFPQVLYHLRDGQTSPWFGVYIQPNNLVAHLERNGLRGVAYQTSPKTGTPQFTWSADQPLVSIIILNRDHVELLKRCIDSILSQTTYPHFEIILVENNSQERETFAYYEHLNSIPQVKVIAHDQTFNYSAFNNWAIQFTHGELLLFLNNDIECIDPGWLAELARWASRPEVGVVGAKLLYPNHTIQHAGLVVGLEGHANHIFAGCREGYHGIFGSVEWYRNYTAVTGACMMVRRSVFDQIGGFDENYSLAFNDIEICLRTIQAGYRVVYTPFAPLFHHEGATRSTYKPSSDITLASQHLRPLIERGDPFYNPNLSLMIRTPTLRRRGEISAINKLDLSTEFLG